MNPEILVPSPSYASIWGRWANWAFVIVTCLIAAMAFFSPLNAHPDELWHIRAAEYYMTHWIPPQVGDPDTLASYSVYGGSYLRDFEPSYFFAGKFAAVMNPLLPAQHLAFRLFSVTLFALLAALFLTVSNARAALGMLLVSPQVWYVFSYCNGDAFPLTLALVLVWLLGTKLAPVLESVAQTSITRLVSVAGLAGLILGLLALSKLNYLPVVGLVLIWLTTRASGIGAAAIAALTAVSFVAWDHGLVSIDESRIAPSLTTCAVAFIVLTLLQRKRPSLRHRALLVLGVMLGVAGSIVGATTMIDRAVNGDVYAKATAVERTAERIAREDFKPSQISSTASYHGLHLREKGIGFHEIFLPPWNWAHISAASSVGVYGYMNVKAPIWYYAVMALLYILLIYALFRPAMGLRGSLAWADFAMTLAAAGAVMFASAYHSWVGDFQAQGRYLFPILAVVSLWTLRYGNLADVRFPRSLICACFALSIYSFAFIGLRKIVGI